MTLHTAPRAALAVAALVLAIVVAGCGSLVGATQPSQVSGPVALGAGQPAPPLRGTTLDGATFDLAALRGKPVVVNFWASWCIPCRSEFPLFESALARHAGSGLTIVGVVFKDDASPARSFARSAGAGWQSVLDPSGSIAASYRVAAPPQTYFIDRAGVVRDRMIGQVLDDAELDQLLGEIL